MMMTSNIIIGRRRRRRRRQQFIITLIFAISFSISCFAEEIHAADEGVYSSKNTSSGASKIQSQFSSDKRKNNTKLLNNRNLNSFGSRNGVKNVVASSHSLGQSYHRGVVAVNNHLLQPSASPDRAQQQQQQQQQEQQQQQLATPRPYSRNRKNRQPNFRNKKARENERNKKARENRSFSSYHRIKNIEYNSSHSRISASQSASSSSSSSSSSSGYIREPGHMGSSSMNGNRPSRPPGTYNRIAGSRGNSNPAVNIVALPSALPSALPTALPSAYLFQVVSNISIIGSFNRLATIDELRRFEGVFLDYFQDVYNATYGKSSNFDVISVNILQQKYEQGPFNDTETSDRRWLQPGETHQSMRNKNTFRTSSQTRYNPPPMQNDLIPAEDSLNDSSNNNRNAYHHHRHRRRQTEVTSIIDRLQATKDPYLVNVTDIQSKVINTTFIPITIPSMLPSNIINPPPTETPSSSPSQVVPSMNPAPNESGPNVTTAAPSNTPTINATLNITSNATISMSPSHSPTFASPFGGDAAARASSPTIVFSEFSNDYARDDDDDNNETNDDEEEIPNSVLEQLIARLKSMLPHGYKIDYDDGS